MVPSAALLLATLAVGQTDTARVEVTVQVLEASNDLEDAGAPASRAARDLAATLNYKSYRTLSQETRTLAIDEWDTITLPNGATLTLAPKAIDKVQHNVRLQVSVRQGERHLETDYTVRNDGTVFVGAGPNGKNVLVLAIVPRAR